MSWQQFANEIGGDEGKAREFLMRHKKGFMLDLGSRDTSVGGVSRSFASANQIYLGGGDLVEGLKGAEIRKGGETVRIQHELIRKVADFSQNLGIIQSAQFLSSEDLRQAQAQAGVFRKDVAQIFGATWKASLSGKISGSTFLQGQGISLYDAPEIGVRSTPGFGPKPEGMKGIWQGDVLRAANRYRTRFS